MEKTFVSGMMFKNPHEKAPEFVRGDISIKVDEFTQFLNEHQNNGWVNIQLLKSQKGALYFALNNWKPKEKGGSVEEQRKSFVDELSADNSWKEINPEDIPF